MKINNMTPSLVANTKQPDKNTKNPAFGAKNPANGLNQFFKLEQSGPMTRSLFILNAFTFLLGSRFFTSRDKDEKRETLIRDIPTVTIAVGGVPTIEKTAATMLEKKTGFAITEKAKNAKNKILINNVNYPTIGNWYTLNDNIKGGLNAFSKRLNNMGGNLKMIYSNLSDEIKTQVKDMPQANDEFLSKLKDNNDLSEKIAKALKNSANNAAKKAEILKTGSKIAGFVTTLVLIGLVIPKLNMVITNAIHKNDAKKAKDNAQV